MKKINILLILLIAMAMTSCREEADFAGDPSNSLYAGSSDSYTGQFKIVWNTINTGYNFWDITDVDWDARYREFLPKFQALDEKNKSLSSRYDTINIADYRKLLTGESEYSSLYKDLTQGLKDSHMCIILKNPYLRKYVIRDRNDSVVIQRAVAQPAEDRITERSYYHPALTNEQMYNLLIQQLSNDPNVQNLTHASWIADSEAQKNGLSYDGHYIYALYQLPGTQKVIPYLWLASFSGLNSATRFLVSNPKSEISKNIMSVIGNGGVYTQFLNAILKTPKENLAGVILDVRENGGGYSSDLKYFAGLFQDEEKAFWEQRHKEGIGRYDMSPWVPTSYGFIPNDTINGQVRSYHRNLASEHIPLVCLCDLNSVSCSEVTALSVRAMGGYLIGERTFGAHGKLLLSDDSYDINYSGAVGDESLENFNYFIYTCNYESRPVGGQCLEGVGITPDLFIEHTKGESDEESSEVYAKQFAAAVNYIKQRR